MANAQSPDARSLQSWEDAFAHPLPVVRRLEGQLRRNIDDNRSKLRVLVGGSYRDLLGTAERIIEMDEQMQRVETLLGDIGEKCNAGFVERIALNHGKMKSGRIMGTDAGGLERGILAQTKILRSCLRVAGRIVRARGDALQAAKLFVLLRLLLKSVTESGRPLEGVADLRKKLHSLRSRLLSYIERSVAGTSLDTTRLPHTLCAHVLVASSTPKDALRHFLQVRYDQLDQKVDPPSESEVLESLALYGQTLIDTRELFPRKVAEVLGQISKSTLILDEQVTSLTELNLDIYGAWIAEDIRTFTPWVRHDQVMSSEVADGLAAWSQQARALLLERLNDYLKVQTDARAILDSRQRFLSRLLDLSSRVKNVTSAQGVEEVRVAFLERMAQLAEGAAEMRDLTVDESLVSAKSESRRDSAGVWDLASQDFDLSNGGTGFRLSILAARHGRDASMAVEIAKLDDWAKRVNEHLDIANDMASTKWEEDLDFDSEFSGTESLQHELAKEDPERLRDRLRQALHGSLKAKITQVETVGVSTKAPAFYIRLWREVDSRRCNMGSRLSLSIDPVSLTGLYRNLASMVLQDVMPAFTQSIALSAAARTATTLWEGSPPLPVQCSPQTFRFLTQLHQSMAARGGDLWTGQCVAELKTAIVEALRGELAIEAFTRPVVDGKKEEIVTNGHSSEDNTPADDGEPRENGHETSSDDASESNEDKPAADKNETPNEADSSGELHREQVVQNLFDTQYLLHVLQRPKTLASKAESLDEVVAVLRSNADLDDASHERLKRSAGEFWKKTYLLFGLLAPGRHGEATA